MATALLITTGISGSAPGEAHPSSALSGAQRLDGSRVSGAVSPGATDTQLSGRVTATVAPESSAVSEREESRLGEGKASRLVDALTRVATPNRPRSETCRSARNGTWWYRQRQRDWLKLRGAIPSDQRARAPRSCPDARYLAQVAKRRSFAARQAYERWQERRTLEDFSVASGSNAWLRAVDEVQRLFPGTSSWLISCSASEGGHGRWVQNSQGSGANGWLQFMQGTFWRMFYAARSDARAKGFVVPRSAASWYSPLGQALAGAWGVSHGRRHEWVGRGC